MTLFGAPFEFFIFAVTLLGVAVLHKRALWASVSGLAATVIYKLATLGVGAGAGFLGAHLTHEWAELVNLFLLLLGFAVLSNQFELSNIPDMMPRFLPDNWTGGLALLAMVFVLSTVLDNIAGAVIGGVIARHVFRTVSIGFLASIVAASNAGGAGSVLGDTTTTMMWISGISPLEPLHAFIAAFAAFAVFGVAGTLHQHRIQPIIKHETPTHPPVDWGRGAVVLVLLAALLATNLAGKSLGGEVQKSLPLLGLGLWAAIILTAFARKPQWSAAAGATRGAVFLVALVATASLMPVGDLPDPSWKSTLGLGVLSAVFDNIPLTALALKQGGYDWGLLAFAVGFGGSMTWFGSSAGVALSNVYPQIRTVEGWLKEGWAIPVAYVVGFFVLLWTMGWNPT